MKTSLTAFFYRLALPESYIWLTLALIGLYVVVSMLIAGSHPLLFSDEGSGAWG